MVADRGPHRTLHQLLRRGTDAAGAVRFDRFGKFPGTVPSMLATIYLQAHHLDLEFYDAFYQPGAYLRTHADHMARWQWIEVYGVR
jgi:hypothetical protein